LLASADAAAGTPPGRVAHRGLRTVVSKMSQSDGDG
jgi:hypothetical protein